MLNLLNYYILFMTSYSFETGGWKAHIVCIAIHTGDLAMTAQLYSVTALAAGTLFMIAALLTIGQF